MRRPAVEHGRDHAEDAQLLVGELAHVLNRLEQLAHATVTQRLALQGHDDRLGSGETVDGQDTERRRAVDEDGVVLPQHREQGARQHVLAPRPAEEVHLCTGQVDRRGNEIETVDAWDRVHHVGQPSPTNEHVVERGVEVVGIEAEREGEARLRVEVHQQDTPSLLSEADAE